MKVCVLASGSVGNSTYIETNQQTYEIAEQFPFYLCFFLILSEISQPRGTAKTEHKGGKGNYINKE